MQRTHKIRLMPTKTQETALLQAVGTVRFVYNWALDEWNKDYAAYKEGKGDRPSAYTLSSRWTQTRPGWSRAVYRQAQTRAILNLGKAWINHWNRGTGKPAFKKRGGRDSFYIDNGKPLLIGKKIRIPTIGEMRMRELPRYSGKILSYTVSRAADQWFVSIQYELPEPTPTANPSVVGVDVGVMDVAVASDGTKLVNPKALTKALPKLKHLQRKLARQQKVVKTFDRDGKTVKKKVDSNRRAKTKLQITKLHLKISNVRNDAIHKFTSRLAKNHGLAVIEDLNVQGMQQTLNRGMRRSLADSAMSEVHRQLQYKMKTEEAPRFFPSSKRCSACGSVKAELPLSVRVFRCDVCQHVQDRDANAAQNLKLRGWVTASSDVEDRRVRRSVKRKCSASC